MSYSAGEIVYLRCVVEEDEYSGRQSLRPCTVLGFVLGPTVVKRKRIDPPPLTSPLTPYSISPIPGRAFTLSAHDAASELHERSNEDGNCNEDEEGHEGTRTP